MSPKTLLGPFGPILAYFGGGGQARNFSKSFWAKKGQNFFPIFFALFRLPKGPGPSKTQNWPCRPPSGPHFGPICGQKGRFWGQKNAFFSKNIFAPIHFLSVPRWSGTLKNRKLTPYSPQWTPFGPILWAFWANLGSKTRFSQKCIFVQNDISGVLRSLFIGF